MQDRTAAALDPGNGPKIPITAYQILGSSPAFVIGTSRALYAPTGRPANGLDRQIAPSSPTRSTTRTRPRSRAPASRVSRPAPDRRGRCTADCLGGDGGDPVGHLAGSAGEVERALPGDHEVGRFGPRRQPDERRRPARRLARGVAPSSIRPKPKPSCRAGPLLQRQPAVGALGEAAQAAASTAASAPRRCPSEGRRSSRRRTDRSAGCRRRRRSGDRVGPGRELDLVETGQAGRPAPSAAEGSASMSASRPVPPSLLPLSRSRS